MLAPPKIDIGKLNWRDASFDKNVGAKALGKITAEEMKRILDEVMKLSHCPPGSFYDQSKGCIEFENFRPTQATKNSVEIERFFNQPLQQIKLSDRYKNDERGETKDQRNILMMQSFPTKNKETETQNFEMIFKSLEKLSRDKNVAAEINEQLKTVLGLIENNLKSKNDGEVKDEKPTSVQKKQLNLTEKLPKDFEAALISVGTKNEALNQPEDDVGETRTMYSSWIEPSSSWMNLVGADSKPSMVMKSSNPQVNEVSFEAPFEVNGAVGSENHSLVNPVGWKNIHNTTSFNFTSPQINVERTESDSRVFEKFDAEPVEQVTNSKDLGVKIEPKVKEMIPIKIMLNIPKDKFYETAEEPMKINFPLQFMQDSTTDSKRSAAINMPDIQKLESNLQNLLQNAFVSYGNSGKEGSDSIKAQVKNAAKVSGESYLDLPMHLKLHGELDSVSNDDKLHEQTENYSRPEPKKSAVKKAFLVRDVTFKSRKFADQPTDVAHTEVPHTEIPQTEVPHTQAPHETHAARNGTAKLEELKHLIPNIVDSGKNILKEKKKIFSSFLPKFFSIRRSGAGVEGTDGKEDPEAVLKYPRPSIVYDSISGKSLNDYLHQDEESVENTNSTGTVLETSNNFSDSVSSTTANSKAPSTTVAPKQNDQSETTSLPPVTLKQHFLMTTRDDLEHYDHL